MAKANHMLAILWMLYSRPQMTADEIAAELEVSVRSVYRYIESLSISGVPIIAEPGHNGGYRLAENFRAFPLFFSDNELKALFFASNSSFRAGAPHSASLASALEKLRYRASLQQAEMIRELPAKFDVVSSRRGGPVEQWLDTLEEAVSSRMTLEIYYHKAQAEEPEWRKVNPYGLAFDAGLWYLAAYCHKRSALRDFRVDRILDLVVTNERFQRPTDFVVAEYFSNHDMIERLQTGPFTEVRVTGTVYAIHSICDHWYLKHCVTERGRTWACLRLNSMSLEEVPTILLSYGTSVTIIEPSSMRDTLQTLAAELVKHHTSQPPLS